MAASGDEFTYLISVKDFDKSLLPLHAQQPGTDEFSEEVGRVLRQEYAEFGGWVQIVVNQETIQVNWRADPARPNPHDVVIDKLEQGEYETAIRMMERLLHHEPNNTKLLCNLGMALSEAGHPDKAEQHLRHAIANDKKLVPARVGLGVALIRQGKLKDAIEELKHAVNVDPSNPWARRNLGGALGQVNRWDEAEPHFLKAMELNPGDQQAVFGLAKCLIHRELFVEADKLLGQAIEMDANSTVADVARQERTSLAQKSFRGQTEAGVRQDAVMYCLGAIQTFENMSNEEVQKIGFEIALLGQQGLDPNDSEFMHRLKSLPGEFSALNLLCLMYVAFKRVAPDHDIGFDLAKEFKVAEEMHRAGEGR